MATTDEEPAGSPLERLERLREEALHAGTEKAVERQREAGKLLARERAERLCDPGSFVELDRFVRHRATEFGMDRRRPWGDAVVTGYGTVFGRKVFLFSQDFTVFGGSLSEVFAEKICKVMDLAMRVGAPIVGLNDSGGARIQEGAASLAGYGYVFERNVRASGVIPQISVIMGPCAGGAVYSPAITDFTFMVKQTSNMFITGPDVIKVVTGEEVSFEELGGAMTHATRSGVASIVGEDDEDTLNRLRYLLSFLPSNNLEDPPGYATTDDPERTDDGLTHVLPDRAAEVYDMHEVVRRVVDDGEFLEIFPLWAMNIVTGFARIDGHAVGLAPLDVAGYFAPVVDAFVSVLGAADAEQLGAGLVVRAEQCRARRGDDVVAHLIGQFGNVGHPQYGGRVVRQNEIAAVVLAVHDRLHVLATQVRRRIHVGDEPDGRDAERRGAGRDCCRHLPAVVEGHRICTDCAKFRGKPLQKQELTRCAGGARGTLVGACVDGHVSKEPGEHAGRSHRV